MRVIVFLLLSLFVIANLAADNEIWEVTVGGAKKIDPSLPEYNYFGTNAGRVKRNAQSVVKTNSLTWNVAYQDVEQNTGVGFDDPIEGPKATAAFESVLNILGNALSVYTQSVNIVVKQSNKLGQGVAAQAGTLFSGSTPGFIMGAFQTKVVTGEDIVNPNTGHGFISYTFKNIDWWYNTSIPTGTVFDFDFITVSLHELTHMLGFISLTNSDGTSAIGTNVRSRYDELMVTGSNKALYDSNGKTVVATSSLTGKDSGLFLSTNSQKYAVYAPSTFQSGSSLSHWDPDKIYALMDPAVSPCMIIRGWSAAEISVLQATGWNFTATAYTIPDTSNCKNGFLQNSMASATITPIAMLISLLMLVIYA